jgi:hypothetical protein
MFSSPRLVETVQPFLDGKGGPPSWAERVADRADAQ